MSPNAAQISTIVEALIPCWPRTFSVDGALKSLRCGKSSIRPSEIARASTSAHRPPGSRAINAANRCEAVSFGSSVSSAASFHGSTFNRESAERTLRGISFPSAPTGA